MKEIIKINNKIQKIINNAGLTWNEKFDKIFNEEISGKVFSFIELPYLDPDTSYEEDVLAFANALNDYVNEKFPKPKSPIKVFQTNAALGYNQLAFLVRLNKSENGYDYLCIGVQNVKGDSYCTGEVTKDLEDYYVEESTYEINDSPLNGSYLFDFWISNFNK
jgi:hypothetical protein